MSSLLHEYITSLPSFLFFFLVVCNCGLVSDKFSHFNKQDDLPMEISCIFILCRAYTILKGKLFRKNKVFIIVTSKYKTWVTPRKLYCKHYYTQSLFFSKRI